MKVSTIAIRPIWKLEMRRLWLGFISVRPRSEDAGSVLLQEQVGLAQRGHPRRLGHVLDAEGRVVLPLTGDQRLAERVAGLTRLAVRLAIRDRWPVGVAVEDRDRVVVIARR